MGALIVFGRSTSPGEVATRKISDGFGSIRPQPGGPWYVINWGSEDGQPQCWEGQDCGSDSCVRAVSEGSDQPFGALSLQIWSDNQVPTSSGIDYRNPTADQAFEVDRIEVERRWPMERTAGAGSCLRAGASS
jgi:hypothetical protein